MDQRTGQSTTIGQHLGHSAGKEDCFLLFASKTTCHLNQQLLRVLPSALPGEAYEPSPSRWLVRWTSRTPRKKRSPPVCCSLCLQLGSFWYWVSARSSCGHYLEKYPKKPNSIPETSGRTQLQLLLLCCSGVRLASLPMGWRRWQNCDSACLWAGLNKSDGSSGES